MLLLFLFLSSDEKGKKLIHNKTFVLGSSKGNDFTRSYMTTRFLYSKISDNAPLHSSNF